MNLGEVFAEPLVGLDAEDRALEGIQTPARALGAVKIGVTAQFLERAEAGHYGHDRFPPLRCNIIAALDGRGGLRRPGMSMGSRSSQKSNPY